MYLVEDKQHGITNLVFTWRDPRRAGYLGPVIEGVELDYKIDSVHSWPPGEDAPEDIVGHAPNNPKRYKVFPSSDDLRQAGYVPVDGTAEVFGSWKDYLKLRHAAELPEEDWFQELDRLDEATRKRRQRLRAPEPPESKDRDAVACWVAQKHLVADSSIREIWYLPRESPSEEIRFLELNDQLAGGDSKPEPIDFGLNVEGVRFRLLVADVTTEQLDLIKLDPARLPSGWVLEGSQVWRRGA
ncbi:hypothetical protein NA78x_005247 [Anatilimnocola sp. NA78]|uniref:hypothetical protein n=1 Tax=Anatilimnocola sp. NA78 TaxID=3415683 RepID=UPI003CE513C8